MTVLYRKSPLCFAILFIGIYVIGASLADELSRTLGLLKSVTLPFLLLLSLFLFLFLRKNRLTAEYGLCRGTRPAAEFLFYLPLVLLGSVNLWFGFSVNMLPLEMAFYVGSMLAVGFLEELIFRGLLFRAMLPSGRRAAVAVSSITFGIGHIVNLVNGSGAELFPTLLQILSATAIGFLFVTIYERGGTLLPPILMHSINNALSAFANEDAVTDGVNIVLSLVIVAVSALYTLWLCRRIPPSSGEEGASCKAGKDPQ